MLQHFVLRNYIIFSFALIHKRTGYCVSARYRLATRFRTLFWYAPLFCPFHCYCVSSRYRQATRFNTLFWHAPLFCPFHCYCVSSRYRQATHFTLCSRIFQLLLTLFSRDNPRISHIPKTPRLMLSLGWMMYWETRNNNFEA